MPTDSKDMRTHRPAGKGPSTQLSSAPATAGKRSFTDGLTGRGNSAPVQLASAPNPTATASVEHEDPFGLHLLGAVQRQAVGALPEGDMHRAAAHGISGSGAPLPHLDRIQASFGPHDVSGIEAHVGGAAAEASTAMGATAYATGNHVAFSGAPDLHTTAHEAAHVVQQRAGVSLKGGVGRTGDVYERQADAVADAVVRGDSAADLLGDSGSTANASTSSLVQRQPAPGGAPATPTVDVTVDWSSPFGDSLTGTVTLRGRNATHGAWTQIASQEVNNAGSTTFDAAERYVYYKATIRPVDDVPGDDQAVGKFKKTELKSHAVGAAAPTAMVSGGLNLNRWNHDNVAKRHQSLGIDPAQTTDDKMQSTALFGRRVRVHELVVPRVQQTNALYEALPEDQKQEIGRSLFVTGGRAYRNQKGTSGAFSNHSVGMAIDVNYNEGKTQNALMETPAEKDLLKKVVEPVVKSDPAHSNFNIWQDQGQAQLTASKVFNRRFPRYLAKLMARDADVDAIDAADAWVTSSQTPWTAATLFPALIARQQTVADVMSSISKADIKAAAAAQNNAEKKQQLTIIARFWDDINAWVVGTPVVDKKHKDAEGHDVPAQNKLAVGMIPLDSRVLQMFLDTGWDWGGNWQGRKDYMHFEDPSLLDQIHLNANP